MRPALTHCLLIVLSFSVGFGFDCGTGHAEDKKQSARSEGEKLLLEMERKLLEAKSLRIDFEIFAQREPMSPIKGGIEIADGNRCRTEVEFVIFDKKTKRVIPQLKFTEVSDGTKNRLIHLVSFDALGNPAERGNWLPPRLEVPQGYNQSLVQNFCRHGMYYVGVATRNNSGKPFEMADAITRKAFKVFPVAKLDGRDAIRVEYQATIGEGNEIKCAVWIDASTKLPLKRAFDSQNDTIITIIEHYRSIELNPKLNPNRFVHDPTEKVIFQGKWDGKYRDNWGKEGQGVYDFRQTKEGRLDVTVSWEDHKMELKGEQFGFGGVRLEGEYNGTTYRYLGRMEGGELVLNYLSVEEKTAKTGSGVSRLTRQK